MMRTNIAKQFLEVVEDIDERERRSLIAGRAHFGLIEELWH